MFVVGKKIHFEFKALEWCKQVVPSSSTKNPFKSHDKEIFCLQWPLSTSVDARVHSHIFCMAGLEEEGRDFECKYCYVQAQNILA